jgi:hypothetical protein
VVEKDKEIATLEDDKRVLVQQRDRCTGGLEQCERDLIECAGGPVWPYIVGIAGGVLAVVGGVMWATASKR